MKVALYARVSTANNGQDPTMQTRELREYCERRGWYIAGEYVDVGISGTKEKRQELDRLMSDAHRCRFDAVIVWKCVSPACTQPDKEKSPWDLYFGPNSIALGWERF
jgi:DNA invertase Pin-like site-specific DNA recombinase